MTIIRLGDKFANLYTNQKIHVETYTVTGFKHDKLGVWAICEHEWWDGRKGLGPCYVSIHVIGQSLRSGYMKRLN